MARSPPCLCLNWALCMIRGPGACRKLAHIQFTVEVPWTPQACVLLCPGPLSSNPFQGGKLGQIGKACHCFTDTEAELDQHPRNLMTVGCPPSWWHSRRQPWALGLLEILATGIGLRCGRQTGLRLLDLERHSRQGGPATLPVFIIASVVADGCHRKTTAPNPLASLGRCLSVSVSLDSVPSSSPGQQNRPHARAVNEPGALLGPGPWPFPELSSCACIEHLLYARSLTAGCGGAHL